MEELAKLDVDWDIYVSLDGKGQAREFHASKKQARGSDSTHVREYQPFAFRAELGFVRAGRRPSGTGYAEFDDPHGTIVPMSMQGLASLFRQISEGRIELTDENRFRGVYYFQKRGTGVSVCALSRKKARELGLN